MIVDLRRYVHHSDWCTAMGGQMQRMLSPQLAANLSMHHPSISSLRIGTDCLFPLVDACEPCLTSSVVTAPRA
jgi:hypothetical protein